MQAHAAGEATMLVVSTAPDPAGAQADRMLPAMIWQSISTVARPRHWLCRASADSHKPWADAAGFTSAERISGLR
jgi:hypothetical protein